MNYGRGKGGIRDMFSFNPGNDPPTAPGARYAYRWVPGGSDDQN